MPLAISHQLQSLAWLAAGRERFVINVHTKAQLLQLILREKIL
jgi:hypothetical protein